MIKTFLKWTRTDVLQRGMTVDKKKRFLKFLKISFRFYIMISPFIEHARQKLSYFFLYNSKSLYLLSLVRIQSIQPLLRFDNLFFLNPTIQPLDASRSRITSHRDSIIWRTLNGPTLRPAFRYTQCLADASHELRNFRHYWKIANLRGTVQ